MSEIPGSTVESDRPKPAAWAVLVSPAYFDVMRIPVRGGRRFSSDDRGGRLPVVVINESMARRHWPAGDALGRAILVEGRTAPVTIIGIVADTKHWDLAENGKAQMYFPLAQEPVTYLRVLARVNGSPGLAAPGVVAAIHRVDPLLPVTEIQPLERVVNEFLLPQRSLRTVLLVSAAFSLGLAILGIYGIVACFVSERVRELAIRSALGARPLAIVRLVTGRSLRLVLRGAAVGVPLAVAAAYALRGLLFGVGIGDPVTYLLVAALVVGVALLAAFLPARRAAAIGPSAVIRMP
jgi:putative ABC transport system permease protein